MICEVSMMMYDSQEKLARLRQHAAVVTSARIHKRVQSGNAVAKCGNRNARSGNPASPRGISRPTDNSAENSDGQENTSAAGSHEDGERGNAGYAWPGTLARCVCMHFAHAAVGCEKACADVRRARTREAARVNVRVIEV